MMAKVKKSQSHVDAKHEKHVKALLGKASKGSVALSTKKAAAAMAIRATSLRISWWMRLDRSSVPPAGSEELKWNLA